MEGGRAYLFNNLCLVSTVSYYLVSTNEHNLHTRITVTTGVSVCMCTCTCQECVVLGGGGGGGGRH